MASQAYQFERRDVSIGSVFQRAFAAIRLNPAVIVLLALVIGALPGLLLSFIFFRIGAFSPGTARTGNIAAGMFGATMLFSVFSLVISALVQGALTRATVSAEQGVKVSIGESLSAALRVVAPLIGLTILWALAVGVGFLLLVIPGVVFITMWAVAVPALVVERTSIFKAFGRSAELTKGSRWKVFGLLLMVLVIYWLLSLVIGLVGLSTFNAASAGQLTLTNTIGAVVAGTIFNMLWGTLQPSLYVELRKAKEGGSNEDLAEVFA